MTTELDYKSNPTPDDSVFKISPSKFADFVEKPHNWYRSEVLGEKSFSHNTSSVIGTCVHYCAEKAAKHEHVNIEDIFEYIDSHEIHEDYDPDLVKEHFEEMALELVNSYVLLNEQLLVEEGVCAEVKNKFHISGTLDALQGTKEDAMIVDYKTYNSKTKPKAIPSYYRYQLLCYAFALQKSGYNVTRIRLVYVNRRIDGGISEKTNKPLKSYPSEVTVLTEQITQEDFDFIQSMLELLVDSVESSKKHPELTHVIFHDPRLKESV